MAIDTLNANNASSASALLAGVNAGAGVGSGGSSSAAATAAEQGDRFLKLLVTQMQNQDPLNPMDNAQITTQMAQISTVSGIDQLNNSIKGMSSALLQSQTMQGAALVGKDVLVPGSELFTDAEGFASGGFELAGPADSVMVSVKGPAGNVIDTLNLGAQGAGRHSFDWLAKSAAAQGLTFSISAKSGANALAAVPLSADRVKAVYSDGGQLNVELANGGIVKYSDIRSVS